MLRAAEAMKSLAKEIISFAKEEAEQLEEPFPDCVAEIVQEIASGECRVEFAGSGTTLGSEIARRAALPPPNGEPH